ncbi:MAG: HRDC domain-containing protein, partial [Armatimonadota bacterium]|nr:HRDC domain-containing protein [Armatimonadota bacterium]
EALFAEGLMHQGDEDAYFVCTVTPKGRAAWQERLPVAAPLPRDPSRWRSASSKAGDMDESNGDGDDLLAALKQWRTAQASRAALPPYCVFSDKTLMEIARARPQTSDDLLEVSGVGPGKLDKYGAEVLKITSAA